MARVTTHTKNRGGTKVHRCARCREPIEPGQRYYYWSFRMGGEYYQHESCGYPRPTQISNRKTAAVVEAAQDAENAISQWEPELPSDIAEDTDSLELDVSELESILEDAAAAAEDVASEYEDSVNNMPDALQYSPTAEAMNDVAERLTDWADQLRSVDFNTTVERPTGVVPNPDDLEGDMILDWEGEWAEAVQQARDAASEMLGDVPEYEG